MVLNATTESGEYKSYSDVRWSANHEDLTKKLTGTCTGNAQKNFALCLTQRAKALNLDLSKEIVEVLRRSRYWKKNYNKKSWLILPLSDQQEM